MFWSGYPWWKHLSAPSPFTSHAFVPSVPSVPSVPYRLPEGGKLCILSYPVTTYPVTTYPVTIAEEDLLELTCTFLYEHFNAQPRLSFHPDTLLPPKDHLLILLNADSSVLGTIRYHFIGHLHSVPIHLVDAFCLHPDHRGKGYGSILLTELHRLADRLDIPHALFLKEGSCLPVLPLPVYSGRYVYRRLSPVSPVSPVYSLTSTQAHKWIDIYRSCQPHTLIITNPTAPSQHWRVYRRDHYWILACFQDAHQRWVTPLGEERIGWITVWLESPDITPEHRQEASLSLSDSVSTHFDWIWTNRQWTSPQGGIDRSWREDGGFHWYTYQWTTNLSMSQSYALMT